ncbi:tryptophan synthase subunit beta, partial [Halobacteriales archaeon SW_10_68_16]
MEEHRSDLGEFVVVNVSGRGDKDLETVVEETGERDIDAAADMDLFREIGGGL